MATIFDILKKDEKFSSIVLETPSNRNAQKIKAIAQKEAHKHDLEISFVERTQFDITNDIVYITSIEIHHAFGQNTISVFYEEYLLENIVIDRIKTIVEKYPPYLFD